MFLLILKTQPTQIHLSVSAIKTFLRQNTWHLFILAFGIGLSLFYGLILLPQQSAASRLDSIIFADTTYLTEQVNTQRRLTLDNPALKLFSNKATAVGLFMLQRLVGMFNPNNLLLLNEPDVSGFSVWSHGLFYWVEIGLFFLGIGYLMSRKTTRLQAVLLIAGMVGFALPTLINTQSEWYMLRSMFTYMLVTLFAAWGLVAVPKKKLILIPLVALYAANVLNFGYQYFYRYPIISLDWSNFDERVLARYLDLTTQANPNTTITVYGTEPNYLFWTYLLYAQKLTPETADEIAHAAQQYDPYLDRDAKYTFKNITFSSFCAPAESLQAKDATVTIIKTGHTVCSSPADSKTTLAANSETPSSLPLSISAVLDSGERMKIYGDTLCSQYDVTAFVDLNNLQELNLESQDAQTFCELWIKDVQLIK